MKRYNGPGNSVDRANALAVDGAGNVHVAGCSMGIASSYDFAVIKYDGDGKRKWRRRYNGPGNSVDEANAVAVDDAGNVFVTGASTGAGSAFDFAVIKYDPGGNPVWTARYDGPGHSDDRAVAIALDGAGNVYVAGGSCGVGSAGDFAVIKFDAGGNQLWAERYNGPGNHVDEVNAMAVDLAGNVHVAGWSYGGAESNYDFAVIKYDTDGNRMWLRRYDGPGHSVDRANAIAVDGAGNVYVTGYSEGNGSSADFATIKYNRNGKRLWVKRFNGTGDDADSASAIAVDDAGNVYVTGASYSADSFLDIAVIKYNRKGNRRWVKRYNGPGNGTDGAGAIALDGAGNVVVAGYSKGSDSAYDFAVIKWDRDGKPIWENRYNGPGNKIDEAVGVAVDGSGNVFVAGSSEGAASDYDFVVVKYDTNGN